MPKKRSSKIPRAGNHPAISDARRARFVDAFIANGQNYAQAARDIKIRGESAQRAFAQAMGTDPETQAMIKTRLEELAAPFAISAAKTVELMAKMALADRRKLFNTDGSLKNITDLSFDDQLSIDGVDVEERHEYGERRKVEATITTSKLKLSKRTTSIDQLAKHFGVYAKDNAQRVGDPEEIAARVRAQLADIDKTTDSTEEK